jgi:hypothetical protein
LPDNLVIDRRRAVATQRRVFYAHHWMKRCCVIMLLLIVGCSGGEPQVPDRAAFDQAVADYLDQRGMGLAISEYKSFTMADDGTHVEAEIAMADAAGMIKATARFIFQFERTDNTWRVTSHRQK